MSATNSSLLNFTLAADKTAQAGRERQMINDKHYLYVEDDPASCQVMNLLMDKMIKAKSLTIFNDSEDFMTRVLRLTNKPDMVLLDIQLQPYDGFDMLRMLRQNPDYATIPVIALTASVMSEEVDRLRLAGFSGVIAKPLSLRQFPDMLRKLFEGESIWNIVN